MSSGQLAPFSLLTPPPTPADGTPDITLGRNDGNEEHQRIFLVFTLVH